MYAVKPTQARSRLAEVVLPSGVDSEPQRKLSLPNLAGPDKNAVKLVGNKGRSSCVIVATEDTRLLEEYTEGNVKLQNIMQVFYYISRAHSFPGPRNLEASRANLGF